MGFKMRVVEDSINLQTLINASDEAGDRIMKQCASVIKVRVEGNLNSLRTVDKEGKSAHTHMADDVVIKTGKDKYGYRYAKVGGGKRTGTLWHIVNDGTYKNRATHFMDNAISQSESEVQAIIDKELRRALGD